MKMGINTKKGISFMFGVALWLYTWAYLHANGIGINYLFAPMVSFAGVVLRVLSGWLCYNIAKDLNRKIPFLWAVLGGLAPRIILIVMNFLPKRK